MLKKEDARVRRSRKLILKTLTELVRKRTYGLAIKPSKIYREASVSRATFSRHYKTVDEIFEQKDQELRELFDEINFAELTIERVWQKILIFMWQNRDVFTLKMERSDDRMFRELVERSHKHVKLAWNRYEKRIFEQIFEFYYYEALGIVNLWFKKGMSNREVERIAARLARLARIADKLWLRVA